MSIIELIAVVFSLACIWLAVKKHVLNWPTGIIGVTAYMILFYQERLYADMILQLVFILQGVYGWYNWVNKKGNETELDISNLTPQQLVIYSLVILIASATWAFVLKNYTNASTPYVDAFAATTSLVANWLMARKKIENWMLWIFVDVIYITLFWYKHLFLSSGIYVVFLILSIKGFIDWNRTNHIKKDLH